MEPSPAGWYPDPYRIHSLRWWDGWSWSEAAAVRKPSWWPIWAWAAAAIYVWLFCFVGSIYTAKDIAALPQPNQQLWVTLVTWSPLLPLLCAALAALIALVFRQAWRSVALSASHAFLWPCVALVFLWVPKAP